MSTLPTPKNPATLLLIGGALYLMTRPKATAAAAPATTANGRPVQTYANPVAVAADAASKVLQMVFGKPASTTTGGVSTTTGVVPINEDARNAVRAGDDYYGAGSSRWYAGNAEAARAAVREGDSYYTGWTAPAAASVSPVVTAFGTFGGSLVDDTIPAAPFFDPGAQVSFNPLSLGF